MKISLGLSILSLLFVIGCACPQAPPEPTPSPPPEPSPEDAMQLARQFCPVIHLNTDYEFIFQLEGEP